MTYKLTKKREAYNRGKRIGRVELFESKKFRQRTSRLFQSVEEKKAFKRGYNEGIGLKKV